MSGALRCSNRSAGSARRVARRRPRPRRAAASPLTALPAAPSRGARRPPRHQDRAGDGRLQPARSARRPGLTARVAGRVLPDPNRVLCRRPRIGRAPLARLQPGRARPLRGRAQTSRACREGRRGHPTSRRRRHRDRRRRRDRHHRGAALATTQPRRPAGGLNRPAHRTTASALSLVNPRPWGRAGWATNAAVS